MTGEANNDGGKTRDIELNIDDRRPLQSSKNQPSKMASLRHVLFTIFAIGLLTTSICSASNARVPRSPTHRDKAKFQELLETVEPASLHDILHEHMDKYKHGMFPEDKVALAAVHQEAPEVASSLVELAKRQAGPTGNSTVSSTSTSSTTSSSVVSSSTPTPPPSSSSSSAPGNQGSTSDVTAPPTTSGTSSASSSSGVVESTTSSTSTDSPTKLSSPAISTSALPSSGSNSPIDSSTSQSSPPPTTQPVTSLAIYVTTLPNGKASTVTRTTVVPAGQPDQTGPAGQSTKTGPAASLQSNGGSKAKIDQGVVMGIAVMAGLITW